MQTESTFERSEMTFVDRVSGVLSHPRVYLLTQFLLGGVRARRAVIEDYIKPHPGLRVLDIGCGPAYTAAYFPKPEYYGFDISPQYIAFANRRYSAQGRFFAQLFDEKALEWLPSVDIVLMLGLLHHLDDETASRLLSLVRRVMKPDGRLFTLDSFYEPEQPWLARYLFARDRGKFIREQEGYVSLANQIFGRVSVSVRNDLFYIPYPSLILECRP
jgi:SAM-dependent methyltransferase